MRILLDFCRACGQGGVIAYAAQRKDVHGHVTEYSEWATCEGCGLAEMITPWTSEPCPSRYASS